MPSILIVDDEPGVRSALGGVLRDEGYSERVIRASNLFGDIKVERVPHIVEWTPAQAAGFCSSTSYGAAYLRTLGEPQRLQACRRIELDALHLCFADAAGVLRQGTLRRICISSIW